MKVKILLNIIIVISTFFLVQTKANATDLTIRVAELPAYITSDRLGVSYVALDISGDPLSVQIQYKRPGDTSYSTFPSVFTDNSREVIFEGSFFTSEGNYSFRAVATAGSETVVSNEVITVLDRTDPSQPTDYSKQRTSSESFRICWKAPNDSDFVKVSVYKSKTPNFTADNTTRHSEVFSSPSETKCIDIEGLDVDVDYFFALQSIDKAGRTSGLIGDKVLKTTGAVSQAESAGQAGAGITQERGGQVLSTATEEAGPATATEAAEATQEADKAGKEAVNRRNLVIALVLIILASLVFFYYKRMQKEKTR